MTACWSEGELRACLDRELPADEMERIGVHLGECPACRSLYVEMSGRAAQVAEWMSALPEVEVPAWPPRTVRELAPQRTRAKWVPVAVAGALAAGLALLAMAVANRADRRAIVTPAETAPVQQAAAGIAPPAVPLIETEQAPAVRPAALRSRRAPAARRPKTDFYLALDDDPIETGLVVRVALDPGAVQADVILGPDGRARAFRLVSDKLNF
jgi:anti-sigma factor RsiW